MAELTCDAGDAPCKCLDSGLFDLIGRKYAMEVVCVVATHGTVRFGELEAHVPDASTSTLSTRLDELEAEGLLRRERYDEIPPRVEYELTADGRELGERMRPLVEWVVDRDGSDPTETDEADHGPPGRADAARNAEGRSTPPHGRGPDR